MITQPGQEVVWGELHVGSRSIFVGAVFGAHRGRGGDEDPVSIIVEDQDRALAFYRDVLGFVEKENIPAGGARWITLASP